jgi:3-hydroxy-3-methylglutaryl CoA synthase
VEKAASSRVLKEFVKEQQKRFKKAIQSKLTAFSKTGNAYYAILVP